MKIKYTDAQYDNIDLRKQENPQSIVTRYITVTPIYQQRFIVSVGDWFQLD